MSFPPHMPMMPPMPFYPPVPPMMMPPPNVNRFFIFTIGRTIAFFTYFFFSCQHHHLECHQQQIVLRNQERMIKFVTRICDSLIRRIVFLEKSLSRSYDSFRWQYLRACARCHDQTHASCNSVDSSSFSVNCFSIRML